MKGFHLYGRLAIGLLIAVLVASPALAQRPQSSVAAKNTLDRTKIPPPAKTPVLRVPAWTETTLSNGAAFIVSEKHDLPLVSFTITFSGGADQFERSDRRGLASITASMMSEGTNGRISTTSRSADRASF